MLSVTLQPTLANLPLADFLLASLAVANIDAIDIWQNSYGSKLRQRGNNEDFILVPHSSKVREGPLEHAS